MASAIAATASSSAVTIHPPASPFALLLRRSRFASYDPAIRQTYSAPPASAHRGEWGLKRPIALRRRNAFISLTNFETRAQQTEWNNAESQVRFIRRFEELGTLPVPVVGTPWYKALGKAKTQWVVDSEFSPEEGVEAAVNEDTSTDNGAVQIEGLGKRGPGAYGSKRAPIGQESHISPNVDAMSPKEFVRYLRKLRQLRPAFLEYLKNNAGGDQSSSLYALAQNMDMDHHRKFITEHASKTLNAIESRNIEQQPHRTGGLMYTHPSPLHTYYTTKPKPGLVLQKIVDVNTGRFRAQRQEEGYVTSFAGLTSLLKKKKAGGKTPLLDLTSEKGMDRSKLENSIAHMKLLPKVGLERPPKVVGREGQGLKAVRIRTEVTTTEGEPDFGRSNPHWPGSREYVAMDRTPNKSRPASFDQPGRRLGMPLSSLLNKAKARENNSQIIGVLREIVGGKPEGQEEDEDGDDL